MRRISAAIVSATLVFAGISMLPNNQVLAISLLSLGVIPLLYAIGFGRLDK
jgi:ABC-type multidrug transport system permease subunit